MQVQDTQAPFHKLLRTTKPVRNWCLRESLVEESYWFVHADPQRKGGM